MRYWLWIFAVAAVIAFVGALVSAAWAHNWYDQACCSGQDCRLLEPTEYRFDNGRWFLRNEQGNGCKWTALPAGRMWDGDSRVRISPDFDMHGCFAAGGVGCAPLCIYVGGGV